MSDAAFTVSRRGGLPFVALPLLDEIGVTDPHQIAVIYALTRFMDGQGRCWPSHDAISAKCGIKKTKLKNVLGELKAAGLLTWDHTKKGPIIIRTDYQECWWPEPYRDPVPSRNTAPPEPYRDFSRSRNTARELDPIKQLDPKELEEEGTSSAAPNPTPPARKKNKDQCIAEWVANTPSDLIQYRGEIAQWLEERWNNPKRQGREDPWKESGQSATALRAFSVANRADEHLAAAIQGGWLSLGYKGWKRELTAELAREQRRPGGSSSQAASDSDQMAGGIPKSLRYVNCAKVVNCPFPIQNGREWLQFDHINPNTPRLWDFFKQVQPYLQVVDRYSREFHARVAWAEQVAAERQGVPA